MRMVKDTILDMYQKGTKYIHDYFKLIKQVDVEITGGTQKIIETDDNGKDYMDKYEVPYGSNSTLK